MRFQSPSEDSRVSDGVCPGAAPGEGGGRRVITEAQTSTLERWLSLVGDQPTAVLEVFGARDAVDNAHRRRCRHLIDAGYLVPDARQAYKFRAVRHVVGGKRHKGKCPFCRRLVIVEVTVSTPAPSYVGWSCPDCRAAMIVRPSD